MSAHRDLSIVEVAGTLGLAAKRSGIGPCPACGAVKRSRSDSRPPIGVNRAGLGWQCHACEAKGDGVSLACWVVAGEALTKGDPRWRQVLERLGDFFPAIPAIAEDRRGLRLVQPTPPSEDPVAVWTASVARSRRELAAGGSHALSYLCQRLGDDAEAVARLVRDGEIGVADRYELGTALAVPLRDFSGEICDVGFRRAGGRGFRRIAGCAAYAGRPLAMMSPRLLAECDGGDLFIAEGVVDWLVCRAQGIEAIGLPGTSSARSIGEALATEIRALRVEGMSGPRRIVVATDADDAGDEAARHLAAALTPVAIVVRVRLRPGEDLASWATASETGVRHA